MEELDAKKLLLKSLAQNKQNLLVGIIVYALILFFAGWYIHSSMQNITGKDKVKLPPTLVNITVSPMPTKPPVTPTNIPPTPQASPTAIPTPTQVQPTVAPTDSTQMHYYFPTDKPKIGKSRGNKQRQFED